MRDGTHVTLGWPVLMTGAVALVLAGAAGSYLALRSVESPPPLKETRSAGSTDKPPGATGASGATPDVSVTLTQEAVKRAGIVSSPVVLGQTSGGLRAPGLVQPNAYAQVVVTPLVSGRVMHVGAVLGETVRRGQVLAQLFGPELAEAATRYISARAELAAHEQELTRTEKLVGIGAASRQELERIHAGHTARRSDVESAAARLRLLGLTADAIGALAPGQEGQASVDVPAPIAGVVTERGTNVGANVNPSTAMFTITDLSTVWVVADVYEKDFGKVRVGRLATIVTGAYPDEQLDGRVSYIDPQISADTRTAKVRVEVPNPRARLRLGMYAEARFGATGVPMPTIPRAAVQNVGNRTVVYLVDSGEPGKFIERDVRLGGSSGDNVAVLSGVEVGDVIVTKGSFALRAERERSTGR
jgi:membrane fusion protein, heavy metal efflux system